MLIEFQVGNYLSFREPVTLSMLASKKVSEYRESNVIAHERTPLLKTAVIYGANASGKSNLLSSIAYMRWLVINSSKEGQAGEAINVAPFKLAMETLDQPSRFEVVFLMDNIRYRYGFEADKADIVKEWLFKAHKKAESALFLRDGEDIEVMRTFPEGKGLEENTRNNALFLSVVANLNGQLSGEIINWFRNLTIIHGLHEGPYSSISIEMIKNNEQRERLIELICKADFGIEDIRVQEEAIDFNEVMTHLFDEIDDMNLVPLKAIHKRYKDGLPFETTTMDFETEESEGTRKYFSLIGPVLKSFYTGGVLVVDELEAKLHPLLTRMIVRLFHSSVSNPKNAQLVFATHDTNLLQHTEFRRDQVWFTEKTQQQATDLYSLAEIKLSKGKVRKDASYGKDYFLGKYGAVPYVGELEQLSKGGK